MLAAAAEQAKNTVGPPVLIIPGIMGSKLSTANTLVWIDPLQITAGQLKNLALPSAARTWASGILLFSYAKLKLRLRIARHDATFYAYDWRLGIEELGAALAEHITAIGRPVDLIAHSMGGLIARVALGRLPKRNVRKLIMLGTPNQGSFAPVQALRGTYPFVRRMSSLDQQHSADRLASDVFGTFPGLYQMLPPRRGTETVDLLDPRAWPRVGIKPRSDLLATVRTARKTLAPADSRMTHIIGINRETVVAVRAKRAGFEYRSSLNGDGTVPVVRAQMKRLKALFIEEAHGNLPNNPRVIRALLDLLRRGRTNELARTWRPKRTAQSIIDDALLRQCGNGKIDWRQLDSAQREAALGELDGEQQPPYHV